MVKMLMGFVLVHVVVLLELAGAAVLTVAAGIAFGSVGMLTAIGVFLLVKSFELDLRGKT